MDEGKKEMSRELAAAGFSLRQIAERAGVSKTAVRNLLAKTTTTAPVAKINPKAKTLDEFRSKHDTSHIIRTRVGELLHGAAWYDDNDFRELCGVSIQYWRRYADSGEFAEYRVIKPNRINAWAPAKMAKQMREILDIHA
jgi:transcriptional regulator with XRE-family HTH domain